MSTARPTTCIPNTPTPWTSTDDIVSPEQQRSRARRLAWVALPTIIALGLAPAALGRSGVVGLVGIVLAVAILLLAQSPVRTGLLVVALVPTTSGLARGLVAPGFRLSEVLVVLGAACLLALPTGLRRRWTTVDACVVLYVALGVLLPLVDLFVVSGRPLDDTSLQTLLGPVQFGLLYFVVSTCFRSDRTSALAQRTLLLASLPVAVLGIAESLGPPAVHELLLQLTRTTAFNTLGYEAVPRAASVFPVWLGLAGYLLVILVLATSLLLRGDRRVLPTWVLVVVIACGLLALVSTLTITIAGTYALVALYLGWRHHRLRQVAALIGIVAVAAQLTFGALLEQRAQAQTVSSFTSQTGPSWLPQTLGYRVQVWQDQYLPSLVHYATTGWGPGFPPGVDWSHTESGYITLLLRGGVPYLAGTVLLLVVLARTGFRGAALAGSRHQAALCEAAALVALVQVPINLTFPYFTASGPAQPAWIVWGLLAAQASRPPAAAAGQHAGANRRTS